MCKHREDQDFNWCKVVDTMCILGQIFGETAGYGVPEDDSENEYFFHFMKRDESGIISEDYFFDVYVKVCPHGHIAVSLDPEIQTMPDGYKLIGWLHSRNIPMFITSHKLEDEEEHETTLSPMRPFDA